MARTEIFSEQTIQFADSGMAGLYIGMFSSVVPLAIGKTYILVWNGTEYECTAAAASFSGVDGVGIGNFAIAGLGENTGEPFLLGTATDGSMTVCYSTVSGSNTISVYLVEEDAPTVTDTLVLLDNQGIEQHLTGVKGLKVLTTGGAEQTFIAGEAVEKTVNLDFSNGNMEVVADEGTFYSKVLILKPSTLTENNIAKDVDVAGIVGTHEGGDNTKGRIEYELNESGQVVSAVLVNMDAIPSYAFYNAKALSSVDMSLSPNLTKIGENAFYGCTALKNITLPKTLQSFGSLAFQGCSNLENVYYEGTLADWLNVTGGKSSNSPLFYADHFYIEGKEVEGDIVIPDGVTKIAEGAFMYRPITSITLPESVTTIQAYAFYYSKITTVTISEAIHTIEQNAFANSALTQIVIPDTVTSLGDNAFDNCKSLTSAIVGSGIQFTDSSNDGYYVYPSYVFRNCSALKTVTLKEGLKGIGYYWFSNASKLESITIPESVERIGYKAFGSASKLTNAYFVDAEGWKVKRSYDSSFTSLSTKGSLSNSSTAATWLRSTYSDCGWINE